MGHRRATGWSAVTGVVLGALIVINAYDLAHGQVNDAQTPATVLDGVFSAQQADRGAAVYEEHCAECHDGADVDGPPLKGAPFVDRWREDALAGLFDFIKTQMPQQTPGSLADADYLAVVAHLLRENAYPPGARELTIAAATTTLLVGPNGPQPLPGGALVEVVGCVARSPDQDWVLARAGRPSRVRAGNEITTAEAAAAAAASFGTRTFTLQNVGDAGSPLSVVGTGGQKVIIKGAFTPRGSGGRIHVTAAKTVADSCGGA